MSDFFRRNLVWVAILLCVTGVVLSIIGIPAGKPVFFFIGIVLALPTIGYLIYQVFFQEDKPELDLAPTTPKHSSSNITSIIANKNDILVNNEINTDDNLEPFYNGYATENEINKRLQELTNPEREQAIIDLPEIDLPVATTNRFNVTTAIENTTNSELLRQRNAMINSTETFNTEITTEFIEETVEEPIINQTEQQSLTPDKALSPTNSSTTSDVPLLDAPDFVLPDKPIMPQPQVATTLPQNLRQVDLTNVTSLHNNSENAIKRKQKAEEKKNLLSQNNLEHYLRRYFIEVSACFLMDRTLYKDKNGIAPYNKFAVNKTTDLPEYTMSTTKGKLYKFCTYLIDAERFIKHSALYDDFITAIEQGIPLSRISETLHHIYRKKYKKDFILNLSNREDWDNIIILVYNNYILNNDNFKDVFTRIPFEIPVAYSEENIVDYLKDADLQERFAEKYNAIEEMGVPTFWSAIYICFINSIKQKLTTSQIESAILHDHKKIARSLKRADTTRRRLKKAS